MRKFVDARYGFLWVTFLFFLLSVLGHWVFGWFAYVDETLEHQAVVQVGDFMVRMFETTFENWQSEFLQLMWQVAGLAYLLYVGSPQSREGDERKDAMLEHILRKVDPKEGDRILKKLQSQFPKG
jgi:hypothetical protein